MPRRRSDLLSRRRLLHFLYELMDNKLTIIAAPAGYGKTSLLIDFANHIEYPVCWYSIDPLDRDPLRFLAYFISALNVRFPSFGESSMAALRSALQGDFNLDHLTTTIINDAYEQISEHFVVVLDDYHLVDGSKVVDQFVSRFIQDVDENCHLIIASRTLLTLPDFPLMVARSQVGGLSFEELAFVPEELQELLLQNYQSTISFEASQDLIRQAEGWITGLLLSTQAIQQKAPDRRRAARVSGVGLPEYLDQVLAKQPVEIQRFLLRSSLLEEFDANLCEEVIGNSLHLSAEPWNVYLDEVIHSNLFVLLVGEDRIWLRYHHLFRDFLQARMAREFPEETRLIQQALAEYYTAHGDWESAYRFYQQLGDVMGKAKLIEQAGTAVVTSGRVKLISEWLDSLPYGTLDFSTRFTIVEGYRFGCPRRNKPELTVVKSGSFCNGSSKHSQNYLPLHCQAEHLYENQLGDHTAAVSGCEKGIVSWSNSKPPEKTACVMALRAMGFSYYRQGKLFDALSSLKQALDLSQSLPDQPFKPFILMELGLVQQAKGDYVCAEHFYKQVLDDFKLRWEFSVASERS